LPRGYEKTLVSSGPTRVKKSEVFRERETLLVRFVLFVGSLSVPED